MWTTTKKLGITFKENVLIFIGDGHDKLWTNVMNSWGLTASKYCPAPY